ncbi:hypothetical protein GCM10010446_20310 [Streptomyces enissocaesilis]|uniref:Bacterial transcriptional activator domain-containing protein n=1 Tax=Streptomyces enissocaesilis TaxID=332589 RepID=A0ABN3X4A7_9ACTN
MAAHPLRERLTWLPRPALYRGGRSSDALLAYEETRRRLAEAIGPGPALRSLHQRVLCQDPSLLRGAAPAGSRRGRERGPGGPGPSRR